MNTNERPVIICTSHRGVFFGYTTATDQEIMDGGVVSLKRARMAIYWGTTRGVMELAEIGPNSKSRISARADLTVNAVTCVMAVTEAATAAWEAA